MVIPGDSGFGDSGDVRAFVAVPLPDELKEQLVVVQRQIARQCGRVARWLPPEAMHITLEFLGDVPRWVLADLPDAIEEAVDGFRSFDLSTAGIGAFPSWRNPKVVWIGLEGETRGLENLRKRITNELRTFSFANDPRPFKPHLTLGRVRNGIDPAMLKKLQSFAPGYRVDPQQFTINRVALFRSLLSPEGATHVEIAGWDLAAN
jgi:2'-5' RNA ligase